ncbi:hypothetical protein D9M71_665580 [compost metagenome]
MTFDLVVKERGLGICADGGIEHISGSAMRSCQLGNGQRIIMVDLLECRFGPSRFEGRAQRADHRIDMQPRGLLVEAVEIYVRSDELRVLR